MKQFQEQVNNLVFKNVIIESDYTKDGTYIEHKTQIQIEVIKKIARKMYQQFKDKMDYDSFMAEFQTQLYFASKRFAKGKTQEQLQQVLDNMKEAVSFLSYIRIVIKSSILDEYIQTNEVLTEKFQDKAYYDAYMMDVEAATTNPIIGWYYKNKEEILTKSQIEFLQHLNRGMAVEVYGKANIARTKRLIVKRIQTTYEKEFNK